MRCSNCGIDNATDARFCNQCATPLNRACPKCAHLNASDAKFCSQCAVALGEKDELAPMLRRHLSRAVRFSGLKSKTLLSPPMASARPSPRCLPISKDRPN